MTTCRTAVLHFITLQLTLVLVNGTRPQSFGRWRCTNQTDLCQGDTCSFTSNIWSVLRRFWHLQQKLQRSWLVFCSGRDVCQREVSYNCLLVNKSASYVSRHAARSCRASSRPLSAPTAPVHKFRTLEISCFQKLFFSFRDKQIIAPASVFTQFVYLEMWFSSKFKQTITSRLNR